MLTELKIKNAGPGNWLDERGLYLQVSKRGWKSWIFNYQLNGRRREMGLGSLADVPAKEARRRAAEARALLLAGEDPIEVRNSRASQKAAQGVTFEAVAEEYITLNEAGWKNAKHASQWRNTLKTYAYPLIGQLHPSAIETEQVLSVLEPIWLTKTETASRVRGRIEQVLGYAKIKGYRSGDNPAAWKGHLNNVLPEPTKVSPHVHHPALAHNKIPEFMETLHQTKGISALCLEWVILSACRSNEGLNARWDEIDLDAGVWTIPAARMKASREHRVPITEAMRAVLAKAESVKINELIFPSSRKAVAMTDMALTAVVRRIWPGITVHGFRSTFTDWAAEMTEYPNEMVELQLAHTVGTKVEQAYRRTDMFEKRRNLMNDWAQHCFGDAI